MKLSKTQMKLLAATGAVLVLYYFFFYPPYVERTRTEEALQTIGVTIATGNKAQIQQNILSYLAEDATIRFDISYAGEGEEITDEMKSAVAYSFTKQQFYSYLGNMLSSVSNYGFRAFLADFTMGEGWNTATAVIQSSGTAQGQSRFIAKLMDAQFYYEAMCEVQLVLGAGQPLVRSLNCRIVLPKPQPLY